MFNILVTTFLRPEMLEITLASYIKFKPDNVNILIADQSPKENFEVIQKFKDKIIYYELPFDCGISYARNFLVEKNLNLEIPYCLLIDDSVLFDKYYDFDTILKYMVDYDAVKVGFHIKRSIAWEGDLTYVPGVHFILDAPKRPSVIDFNGLEYIPVDITRNNFLATTESLYNIPWCSELKLCEHEDNAYRYKEKYKNRIFYSKYISFDYLKIRNEKYNEYRNRCYTVYLKKLREIYKMTGWISTTVSMQKLIDKSKGE